MKTIDLNCDLGEGAGQDEWLMPLITSANVACGAHAGDRATMEATVAWARASGVAVGAHPGFADRAGFGRREMILSPAELRALIIGQIETLRALTPLTHVKPHGALYNLAARDRDVATTLARAVREVDRDLRLVGLAGSESVRAGRAQGLWVSEEVFADRTYQPDGSLTPRSEANALVHEEADAVAQVLRMVREGVVRATDGRDVSIRADTVCLHGDGAHAVAFARRLRAALQEAGMVVRAPDATG